MSKKLSDKKLMKLIREGDIWEAKPNVFKSFYEDDVIIKTEADVKKLIKAKLIRGELIK